MNLGTINMTDSSGSVIEGSETPARGQKQLLPNRTRVYYIVTFLFALLYQTPDWPSIFQQVYHYPMIDRAVYENALIQHNLPVDYILDFEGLRYFTFEWLWNASLAYLNRDLGLRPDQIFFFITTLVLWRFSFEVSMRVGLIYVPLLLNPLIVDFAFSQLRLAAAIGIISFFWRNQRGLALTIFAYVSCISIHTSVLLFAVMHLSANIFAKPRILNLAILILVGLSISAAIGPLRGALLGAVGDRRSGYYDMSSSIAYLSFWLLLWILLLARWRDSMRSIDSRYAIVILSILALNTVTGGYSTRFIAAAFPALLVSMVEWKSKPVSLALIIFIPYSFLQWLYWLRVS